MAKKKQLVTGKAWINQWLNRFQHSKSTVLRRNEASLSGVNVTTQQIVAAAKQRTMWVARVFDPVLNRSQIVVGKGSIEPLN